MEKYWDPKFEIYFESDSHGIVGPRWTGKDFLIHQGSLNNPEPAVKYYLQYYYNIYIEM